MVRKVGMVCVFLRENERAVWRLLISYQQASILSMCMDGRSFGLISCREALDTYLELWRAIERM